METDISSDFSFLTAYYFISFCNQTNVNKTVHILIQRFNPCTSKTKTKLFPSPLLPLPFVIWEPHLNPCISAASRLHQQPERNGLERVKAQEIEACGHYNRKGVLFASELQFYHFFFFSHLPFYTLLETASHLEMFSFFCAYMYRNPSSVFRDAFLP